MVANDAHTVQLRAEQNAHAPAPNNGPICHDVWRGQSVERLKVVVMSEYRVRFMRIEQETLTSQWSDTLRSTLRTHAVEWHVRCR